VDAPAGFEEFVRDTSRGLLRTAWLLCGEWPAAEDLVQSALAATWTHWAGVTRRDAPEVYARRVILTTYLRGQRRRWTGELASDELPESTTRDDFADSDRREALLRALRTLPARQRAVITLRYFSDLTERDTAAAMGCSVGTVKSHSAKAIARLRETSMLSNLLGEGVRE
jgi:RNA polymerase sigma-70 factor (sigma-E family)